MAPLLRIRAERLARGWTQQQLGFHAGVSAADLSRIETGRMRPYPGQLRRLAFVLGMPEEALLQTMTTSDESSDRD